MGIAPFAGAAKLPSRTNAKLPKRIAGLTSRDSSTKLPTGAGAAATDLDTKLSNGASAKLPQQRLSAAERLRRLEEAMAFLRQLLAAGPQPARKLLKAANTAGIAERTLHRAKDLLGVISERSGGYAGHGQWVWFPPVANDDAIHAVARETGVPAANSR